MLSDTKKLYGECADKIPDWRKLGRSELCFKYIECRDKKDDNLAAAYLSAIMYKFMNVVEHNYKNKWFSHIDEETCYDWLVTSILYVLNRHVWTDPNNELYGDKDAPEKCINVKMFGEKINYTAFAKRQKRNVLNNSLSLDAINDESSDSYFMPTYDDDSLLYKTVVGKIKNYFNKKDYFNSFLLDSILNCGTYNLSDDNETVFKKIKHHMMMIDDDYCMAFADTYKLDYQKVLLGYSYIQKLSHSKMVQHLKDSLFMLKHDADLLNYLKDN